MSEPVRFRVFEFVFTDIRRPAEKGSFTGVAIRPMGCRGILTRVALFARLLLGVVVGSLDLGLATDPYPLYAAKTPHGCSSSRRPGGRLGWS